jgi:hypothetical protein
VTDQDNKASDGEKLETTVHRHSKVITAFRTLDKALHWRFETKNILPDEEESIEIRFFVLLIDCPVPMQAAAMKSLLKQMEGDEPGWFSPARKEWVFDLDQLKKQFMGLEELEWCTGSVRVEPEFQVEKEQQAIGSTKYYESFIVFYVNPKVIVNQRAEIDDSSTELTSANQLYQDVKELIEACSVLNPADAKLVVEKAKDAIKEFGSTNQAKKVELREWKIRAESVLAPQTFKHVRERTEERILEKLWPRPIMRKVVIGLAAFFLVVGFLVYVRKLVSTEQVPQDSAPRSPTPAASSPPLPSSPSPTPSVSDQTLNAPVTSAQSLRICMRYEESKSAFDGKITVATGAISFEGNPLRHFVTFTVTSSGFKAVKYIRKENGNKIIYKASRSFEVVVVSIDAINACFDIHQLS